MLQERLYCIRYVDPATGERRYQAPSAHDLAREGRVLELLRERFDEWQAKGYIPSRRIEPGRETDRLPRERGWTHWHHLFNPRQLLLGGLFAEAAERLADDKFERAVLLLASGRLADWNSRLCRWNADAANEKTEQSFYNPALNPMINYGCRTLTSLATTAVKALRASWLPSGCTVLPADARFPGSSAEICITDPGYADAINYEELSEFFLAWYAKRLPVVFPDWYADSKRALAVRGKDEGFRRAMVECYRHFSQLMRDDGLQIVMFTHQDAEVWSDLALILWAAGLRVTAAWTIATERASAGTKQGNYVQGTVLLVLRKRSGERRGDMSDVFPEVQKEVQRQLKTMLDLVTRRTPTSVTPTTSWRPMPPRCGSSPAIPPSTRSTSNARCTARGPKASARRSPA